MWTLFGENTQAYLREDCPTRRLPEHRDPLLMSSLKTIITDSYLRRRLAVNFRWKEGVTSAGLLTQVPEGFWNALSISLIRWSYGA